jgi:cytochrome c peroxidase
MKPAALHRPAATALGLAAAALLATLSPTVARAQATQVSVGEAIFNDKSLSASGKLACSSCHAKPSGLADPAGTTLPMGGPAGDKQGHRSSMSLGYLNGNGAFRFDPQGGPVGGFFWDGRANSRAEQAAGPLFNPNEMALSGLAELSLKVRQAPYFADLVRLFSNVRSQRDQPILQLVTAALAAYQTGDPDYALFNSKFDRVADGTATFTAQEARGLQVFNDPQRGNCASCHTSAPGPGGQRPVFTDFRYHALGLPRNMAIQANADPNFRDMGLCGPDRTDLTLRVDLCGAFRTPTLRNVAKTGPYFHNAAVGTLLDAVSFYATRDTDPGRWYPLLNGQPDKFNDLPLGFRGNVVTTPPFAPLPGNRPRLTGQDVADLVAFLNTLSDDPDAPPGGALLADPARAAALLQAAPAPAVRSAVGAPTPVAARPR